MSEPLRPGGGGKDMMNECSARSGRSVVQRTYQLPTLHQTFAAPRQKLRHCYSGLSQTDARYLSGLAQRKSQGRRDALFPQCEVVIATTSKMAGASKCCTVPRRKLARIGRFAESSHLPLTMSSGIGRFAAAPPSLGNFACHRARVTLVGQHIGHHLPRREATKICTPTSHRLVLST